MSSTSSVAPSVSPPILTEGQKSKFSYLTNYTDTKPFVLKQSLNLNNLNQLLNNVSLNEHALFRKQVEHFLDNYLKTDTYDLDYFRKFSNEKLYEFIYVIIDVSLSQRTDLDRLKVSKLILNLQTSLQMEHLFKSSLKLILEELPKLEQQHHCVKSNISVYIARAVLDGSIDFKFLIELMKNGNYYPMFFIILQELARFKIESAGCDSQQSQVWVRGLVERSRVSLIDMLPDDGGRTKTRLRQVLDDRELNFVQPMISYESSLLQKINDENSNSYEIKKWIEENISQCVIDSNDFIHCLTTW